jgi:hypothetical protein
MEPKLIESVSDSGSRKRVRIFTCGYTRALLPRVVLMTTQDVKAMIAAGYECEDAVKAFDAAIEQADSKPAIVEALHTLIAKRKAYQAFGDSAS